MAVAVGEQRRKREAMDLLVSEIAKGEEENITLCLRTSLERGWLSNFMDSLTDAKKKKDGEIDRICSRHYGDFLTSVNEMLKMRGSAGHLTDQVNEVHSQFSSTGGDLVKVLDDLNKIQLERENTRQLLESTLHCKEIAAMMVTTKKQIEADDHYNAMRSIELIKEEAKVLTVKPMVKCLENWLPIAVNKLLYSAKSEADIFLQLIRKKIEVIGSTILIRQGQVSAYNTNQDIISANTNKLHRQFSNDAALEDQNAMLSTRSSISLKYIRSNGTVFGLAKWASPKEFDSLVPQHFLQSPSETGVELVDNSLCDIGPLHKVLHLYAVLGNLAAYHEHYRSSREIFFTTLLKTAERGANQYGLSAAIPRYFDSLVGFFTIECAHRRSVEISDGAFSYAELSALWDRACVHINTLCFNLAITLTSPDVLLSIKEEVLLLIDVMCDESFGFKPAGLYEVMKNLWEVFEGLQIQSMVRACTQAMEQCAYQPFYVTSQEVFNRQVRAYRLDSIKLNDEAQYTRTKDSRLKSLEREKAQARSENAAANLDALEDELLSNTSSNKPNSGGGGGGSLNSNQFADEDGPPSYGSGGGGGHNSPLARRMNRQNSVGYNSSTFIAQTFPFSGVVPVLIRQFHSLIVRYFIYAVKNHHLGSRGEEICNAVVAAYQTIAKSFSSELSKDGSETPLSKACQISIDAGTLALASEAIWLLIENALKQFRWTEKLDIYISKAIDRSISQLRQVVTQSQDMIFELLSNKIEDLLGSLVFINFEPDTIPNGPHESIEEIIEFLQITFMCLTHLPLSVREAAHFTCCSRVANGIMSYILSPKVTKINILCVLAFDNDVKRLTQFSDSCGIPHLKQCFEEFSELVRALLSADLHFMGDNAPVRNKLLTRLTVGKFVQVLDKMVPTVLTNATQHLPRMEKPMVKGLVKKLRSLPQAAS